MRPETTVRRFPLRRGRRAGPPGSICVLTYDLPHDIEREPGRGDYLRSDGGSAYLIRGVRRIQHREPRRYQRYALTCVRLERLPSLADLGWPSAIPPKLWSLHWYARGRAGRSRTATGFS